MKYDVRREHVDGSRLFLAGDVRDADPSTVSHLVRAGVLAPSAGEKAEKPASNKAAPKPQNKAAQ